MNEHKGFITIATGKEEYYQLAYNLLRSYHMFCDQVLPFAILCDRENEYTQAFDDVIVFPGGATCSYLDKLDLGNYLPYEETIFIDSDCLAYGNLNQLFDYFKNADDFSCFGRVLPLDDKTGWFEYENLGILKEKVNYVVGLHGGIYYMRRGAVAERVFEAAKEFIPDYASFRFKGKFDTPGDEPLVALSMACHGCRPVPFAREAICCYWEYENDMRIDISRPSAQILREPSGSTILVHWGTRFTRELEYKKQLELLAIRESGSSYKEKEFAKCRKKYAHLMSRKRRIKFFIRVLHKLKRMLKIK